MGTYCGEAERVDFYTKSSNVLLLKFTSQVALDKGGLVVEIDVSADSRIAAWAVPMMRVLFGGTSE
jgi:hypothetical protein